MQTTRSLFSPVLTLPRLRAATLMSRIGRRLKAFLTRRAQIRMLPTPLANLPVTGRVVAISSVETFNSDSLSALSRERSTQELKHESAGVSPIFALRRPGVQGRWKSTDRVAMF